MEFMENWEETEKFEKLKEKVLKYILYKKRCEQEIRNKYASEDAYLLEDVIDYLKEAGYINDVIYIERTINEFLSLKNLSIKEISYKISQKGVSKDLIDTYICDNKDKLEKYEILSAKSIINKKNNLEKIEIKNYLLKKGYLSENIKIAFDEN